VRTSGNPGGRKSEIFGKKRGIRSTDKWGTKVCDLAEKSVGFGEKDGRKTQKGKNENCQSGQEPHCKDFLDDLAPLLAGGNPKPLAANRSRLEFEDQREVYDGSSASVKDIGVLRFCKRRFGGIEEVGRDWFVRISGGAHDEKGGILAAIFSRGKKGSQS